jgi:hypothetical protein
MYARTDRQTGSAKVTEAVTFLILSWLFNDIDNIGTIYHHLPDD